MKNNIKEENKEKIRYFCNFYCLSFRSENKDKYDEIGMKQSRTIGIRIEFRDG